VVPQAGQPGGAPRHAPAGQHPQARDPYYKTQMCPFGAACAEQSGCFFAHSPAERRPVPAQSPVDGLMMGPAFPMLMAPMMPGMGMPVMPPMMPPGMPFPPFDEERQRRREEKEEKKRRKEKEKEKERRREREKAAKDAARQKVVLKPGKRADQAAPEKPKKKERRVDEEDL